MAEDLYECTGERCDSAHFTSELIHKVVLESRQRMETLVKWGLISDQLINLLGILLGFSFVLWCHGHSTNLFFQIAPPKKTHIKVHSHRKQSK